ncbi:hypothetical protein CFP56_032946 [Quercus suber]|uniref:Uncharacterized protein n=1 Tax=Quercus suber TaxID=58331 RepID=A0AAW0JFN4_QUESU
MACKASFADQQKQVQENIHPQIISFSMCIDEILLLYTERIVKAQELPPQTIDAPCQSGLGFNIGQPTDCPGDAHELPPQPTVAPRWSGLGFVVGSNGQPTDCPSKVLFAISKLFPMLHCELEVV